MTTHILAGFLLGAVIAALAWRLGALSASGAWAATLTGGLIFGLGGLPWAVLLLTFFISSSLLSRLFARRKAVLDEKFAKGTRRDWGQVLANGGLGALLALIALRLPGEAWPWFAFGGAMAAVNADTWATELGAFSLKMPRLITNGRQVERGTSGGITLTGYAAAWGGALLIGLASLASAPNPTPIAWLAAISLAGLAGSTLDSILGASLQAIYYCPACRKETERFPRHTCGTATERIRGLAWLNNDWVNFACSLTGAGSALLLWDLFLR